MRTQGGHQSKQGIAEAAHQPAVCSPCQGSGAAVVKAGMQQRAARKSTALQRRGAPCASGVVPFPIREQTVSACSCSAHGAAQSCLACTDHDLPAGSACGLLVNSGKTANHRKSDTEIATLTKI